MKILLVEDDPSKLQAVAARLSELKPPIELETAHNAAQAKRALAATVFDIMILDVSLPPSADLKADPKGGLDLLRSVARTDRYQKPREIIGLTAYPKLKEEFAANFADSLWTLIHFDDSSEEWWNRIRTKIDYLEHLRKAESDALGAVYETELCVITALYEPELKAVLRIPWDWTQLRKASDSTQYWQGCFSRGGQQFKVVAACAVRMGMPSTAILAMKMIELFRPRYICMTGIAAGIKGECSLGDVIAADPCWDWGSGKFVQNGTEVHFQPAPEQMALDPFVKSEVKALSMNGPLLDRIRDRWTGQRVNTVLRLHIGPLASGASVLADGQHAQSIKQQQRKVIGIDMEAYAVFAAAEGSRLPRPLPLVLKGVVDFAGPDKQDSFQEYAAYSSASVLQALMEGEAI